MQQKKYTKQKSKENIRHEIHNTPHPIARYAFLFLLLVLVCAVLYGRFVVHAPLVFDDNVLIENNSAIRSLHNIGSFFSNNVIAGSGLSSNFYRPAISVLHALTYAVSGLNPAGYHLLPVALHCMNSFLIGVLLLLFGISFPATCLVSLLFLVHPVQVESAAYSYGEPFSLFFVLVGIVAYTALFKKRTFLFYVGMCVATLCFVCGLLSKETAVICFLFVWALHLAQWHTYTREQKRNAVVASTWFFLIAIGYMYYRFFVLNLTGTIGLTQEKNAYTEHLSLRLITFVNVLWEYAKLLFYPRDLYLERPYTAFTSLGTAQGLFGVFLIVYGMWVAVRSFIRTMKGTVSENYRVFLGIAWCCIGFLPVSGIIPLNAMYLEHWLYFPLVGICVLLGDWYDHRAHKRLWCIIAVIALLMLSVRTYTRVNDWSDAVRFYTHELHYNNNSARVHNNLAMEYSDRRQLEQAVYHYQRAIALYDVYPQTHHNLGNLYLNLKQYENAYREFFEALRINPNFSYSYRSLYLLYRGIGDTHRAQMCQAILAALQQRRTVSPEDVERLRRG